MGDTLKRVKLSNPIGGIMPKPPKVRLHSTGYCCGLQLIVMGEMFTRSLFFSSYSFCVYTTVPITLVSSTVYTSFLFDFATFIII